ncbi:hypothetical protein [Priestia filamentosa]|uniref:hypothetical protein n=1 Tax=Priestia filamentosa TaxID=1402861 RepID=UPI003981FF8E
MSNIQADFGDLQQIIQKTKNAKAKVDAIPGQLSFSLSGALSELSGVWNGELEGLQQELEKNIRDYGEELGVVYNHVVKTSQDLKKADEMMNSLLFPSYLVQKAFAWAGLIKNPTRKMSYGGVVAPRTDELIARYNSVNWTIDIVNNKLKNPGNLKPVKTVQVVDEIEAKQSGKYHVYANGQIIWEHVTPKGKRVFTEVDEVPKDKIGGVTELDIDEAFDGTIVGDAAMFVFPAKLAKKSVKESIRKGLEKAPSLTKKTRKKAECGNPESYLVYNKEAKTFERREQSGDTKGTGELSRKASEPNFNDTVKNGGKTSKHREVKNKNSLPGKGEPNSSADLLNPDGTVKQRRYYDEQGRAKEDIDFNHSDDGTHTFPHRHKWDWSKKPPRQKPE